MFLVHPDAPATAIAQVLGCNEYKGQFHLKISRILGNEVNGKRHTLGAVPSVGGTGSDVEVVSEVVPDAPEGDSAAGHSVSEDSQHDSSVSSGGTARQHRSSLEAKLEFVDLREVECFSFCEWWQPGIPANVVFLCICLY